MRFFVATLAALLCLVVIPATHALKRPFLVSNRTHADLDAGQLHERGAPQGNGDIREKNNGNHPSAAGDLGGSSCPTAPINTFQLQGITGIGVITNPVLYVIYYGFVPARDQTYMTNFVQEIGNSAWFNSMTSYFNASNVYAAPPTFGGAAYVPAGTTKILSYNIDAFYVKLINQVITQQGWTYSPNAIYNIVIGQNVTYDINLDKNTVGGSCGWHQYSATGSGNPLFYSVIHDQVPAGYTCSNLDYAGAPFPYKNSYVSTQIQIQIATLFHEICETISDANIVTGWRDSTTGNENGDACRSCIGDSSIVQTVSSAGSSDSVGGLYNLVLGASNWRYLLQLMFDIRTGTCVGPTTANTPGTIACSAVTTTACSAACGNSCSGQYCKCSALSCAQGSHCSFTFPSPPATCPAITGSNLVMIPIAAVGSTASVTCSANHDPSVASITCFSNGVWSAVPVCTTATTTSTTTSKSTSSSSTTSTTSKSSSSSIVTSSTQTTSPTATLPSTTTSTSSTPSTATTGIVTDVCPLLTDCNSCTTVVPYCGWCLNPTNSSIGTCTYGNGTGAFDSSSTCDVVSYPYSPLWVWASPFCPTGASPASSSSKIYAIVGGVVGGVIVVSIIVVVVLVVIRATRKPSRVATGQPPYAHSQPGVIKSITSV